MPPIEHIVQKAARRRHDTPLLFQHGAWHGAWCWQSWLDYFNELGYDVHAISLPGHGRSPALRHINRYTLGDYVRTLAGVVRQIRPAPVLIGHSMGGAILQKYLETYYAPAVVMLAPVPAGGVRPMFIRLLRRYPLSTLKGVLTLNTYPWLADTPRQMQQLLFGPQTAVDVPAFHAQLVRESFAVGLQLMRPFARRPASHPPVRVYAGTADALFSVAEAQRTAARYAAECVLLPGQAHNLMQDPDWQTTARLIDRWLVNEVGIA